MGSHQTLCVLKTATYIIITSPPFIASLLPSPLLSSLRGVDGSARVLRGDGDGDGAEV